MTLFWGEMMAFHEHEMYQYVKQNLRRRYPGYNGWRIYIRDRWEGYEPDFVVERRNRRGRIERIVREVKATSRVCENDINQLNSYVRNLSGRNVKILEKVLVVPAGADTSIVPNDIEIMFLRSFKCEGDDIVWYQ